MNPKDEAVMDVRAWLDTWAPMCGAPRAVFEEQFKALMANVARAAQDPAGFVLAENLNEIIKRACR